VNEDRVIAELSRVHDLLFDIDQIANGPEASIDYDLLRIAAMLDEYYGRNG
jgi:hypothetical protein